MNQVPVTENVAFVPPTGVPVPRLCVHTVLDQYDGAIQFSYNSKKFGVKALLYI